MLVLDNGNCFLYELYNAAPGSNGSWSADSTTVWDLLGNEQRPYSWTSADAAGLPIFPGLVRYDEAASGTIQHAFRFTVPHTRAAFIPPASHWAANTSDPNAPPMGMRLRLKSSYDISGYSSQMQTILAAMKKYGLILADNGSALYVTGASDSRWGSDLDSLTRRLPLPPSRLWPCPLSTRPQIFLPAPLRPSQASLQRLLAFPLVVRSPWPGPRTMRTT